MQKILIVSDTHGKHRTFEQILEKEGPVDMLIHLGDTEGGEDYLCALADCECHIVGGNNDFFSDLDREEEFFIGKYRTFITHGHTYRVSMHTRDLEKAARQRGVDIVMFGHTHRPYFEEKDGLVILNPGSVSYPRQEDRRPSYMIMEMDDRKEAHFTQHFL